MVMHTRITLADDRDVILYEGTLDRRMPLRDAVALALQSTPSNAAQLVVALVNACRCCGCTDDTACPGGCHWVEPDLCSACRDKFLALAQAGANASTEHPGRAEWERLRPLVMNGEAAHG